MLLITHEGLRGVWSSLEWRWECSAQWYWVSSRCLETQSQVRSPLQLCFWRCIKHNLQLFSKALAMYNRCNMVATLCSNSSLSMLLFCFSSWSMDDIWYQIVIKSQLASPWTFYEPKRYCQTCVPVVAEIVWLLAITPRRRESWTQWILTWDW